MPEKLTFKELVSVEKLNRVGEDLKHGVVVFDEARCKGCTLCEIACFTAVIYDSKSKRPKMKKGAEALCVACGACTAICPEDAIEITEFLEFYKYFRWLDRDEPQPPRRF